MFQELKFQLSTAILTILTIAAGVSAFINFEQQGRFRSLRTASFGWTARAESRPCMCSPQSGGANAGVHAGDRLERIEGVPVDKASTVMKILVRVGPWRQAQYLVNHGGVSVPTTVVIGEAPRTALWLPVPGRAGLPGDRPFRLFPPRQRTQSAALLYFLPDLVSSSSASTTPASSNTFDKVIYFGNVAAGLLAPTVFLHFCLTFPEPRHWMRNLAGMALLYVPAALFLLAYVGLDFGRRDGRRSAGGSALAAGPFWVPADHVALHGRRRGL